MKSESQNPAFLVGDVRPSCLRLPLKTKWFEMTKAGIKTEDYREINDYWISRLCYSGFSLLQSSSFNMNINGYWYSKKTIEINIMTLGYPKSTDDERILKLKHKGIEIRTES